MQINVISKPKYRMAGRFGDDVPLVMPGIACGVFDGATDARGTQVDGVSAGRFAALTVAGAAAALLVDPQSRRMPGADIVAHLARALSAASGAYDLPIPPSTTIALAIDCGADWRFFTLGDSGIRINGTDILCCNKIIDDVSTHARIAIFRHLSQHITNHDALELATRRAIFMGLDNAVQEGIVPKALAQSIIAGAASATGLQESISTVAAFLSGGISGQHRFANCDENPLCFDTMNGGAPRLGQMIDEMRPKASVRSIEVFTDGYVAVPEGITADDWEASFNTGETEDFHKTGRFPCVKGSTTDEVFDDRTVVILSGLTC